MKSCNTHAFQNHSLRDLPRERWRDIPGTDGRYQVSDKGRARRMVQRDASPDGATARVAETIIRQQANRKSGSSVDGNCRYSLNFDIVIDGKRRRLTTARLVYHLFVEAFDLTRKDLVVLYRDDDSLNVCAGNLYLGTAKDKVRLAATRLDPQGFTVSRYTLEGHRVDTYPSCAAAAEALGLSRFSIRDAIRQRGRVTVAGYRWRRGDAPRVDVTAPLPHPLIPKQPRPAGAANRVSQYDYDGIRIGSYLGIHEASRETAVSRPSIRRALQGKYIHAGGYLWAYGDSLRIDLRRFKQHPRFKYSALARHLLQKRQRNLAKLAAAGRVG